MMYILTGTPKRKNGRRHIIIRTYDLKCAKHVGAGYPDCYKMEIYTGNWKPLWFRSTVDGTWMKYEGGEE